MASRRLRKHIFFHLKACERRNFDLCVLLRMCSMPDRLHMRLRCAQNFVSCACGSDHVITFRTYEGSRDQNRMRRRRNFVHNAGACVVCRAYYTSVKTHKMSFSAIPLIQMNLLWIWKGGLKCTFLPEKYFCQI